MKWEYSLASLSHKRLDSLRVKLDLLTSISPSACAHFYTQRNRLTGFVFLHLQISLQTLFLTSGFVFVMDEPQDFRNTDTFNKLHSLSSASVLEPVLNNVRGRLEPKKGKPLAQNSRGFVLTQ